MKVRSNIDPQRRRKRPDKGKLITAPRRDGLPRNPRSEFPHIRDVIDMDIKPVIDRTGSDFDFQGLAQFSSDPQGFDNEYHTGHRRAVNDARSPSGNEDLIKQGQVLTDHKTGADMSTFRYESRRKDGCNVKRSKDTSFVRSSTNVDLSNIDQRYNEIQTENRWDLQKQDLEMMNGYNKIRILKLSEQCMLLQTKPFTRASARFIDSQNCKVKRWDAQTMDDGGGVLPYTAYYPRGQ